MFTSETYSSIPSSSPAPGASPATNGIRNWYAVRSRHQYERRVADALDSRSIEKFYPVYRMRRQWKNGTRPIVELPLLPSYLFVRIAVEERPKVLEVPVVVNIVSNGKNLTAISQEDISRLQTACGLGLAQPHPLLTVGAHARIVSGPLAGLTGIISELRGALRIVMHVAFTSRAVAVQVEATDVEPISPAKQS